MMFMIIFLIISVIATALAVTFFLKARMYRKKVVKKTKTVVDITANEELKENNRDKREEMKGEVDPGDLEVK